MRPDKFEVPWPEPVLSVAANTPPGKVEILKASRGEKTEELLCLPN